MLHAFSAYNHAAVNRLVQQAHTHTHTHTHTRRLYTTPPAVPKAQEQLVPGTAIYNYATILSISGVLNTVKSQTCTCYTDNKFITQHTKCLRL